MRRLNRTEYDNTVADLLEDDSGPASGFLADETAVGFDNIAAVQTVSPVLAEQYLLAAESVARRAVSKLASLLPCSVTTADETCALEFTNRFGQRAWRRPLTQDESQRLMAIFRAGSDEGFESGIELALTGLLTSAPFLFRVELGETDAADASNRRPSGWEMASRLSYLFWGSMPDAALFAAAETGQLGSPELVRAQAERLLQDPRARRTVRHFYGQWLQLNDIAATAKTKNLTLFPEYGAELAQSLRSEADAFLESATFDSGVGYAELFTGHYSFMNSRLAAFYGVTGPTGEAFEKVALNPAQRSGFLTQGGVLSVLAHTDQSSPTLRGRFVREQLLCMPVPPPPPTVNNVPSAPVADRTTRERVSAHTTNPACAACHSLMDPIGVGFEHYDGVGRWREQESGQPIDSTGSVVGADFEAGFDGAVELSARLAGSALVRSCFSRQWFRFAYGRVETDDDDAALVERLGQQLQASGGDIRKFLLDLTQTDAFLRRFEAGDP